MIENLTTLFKKKDKKCLAENISLGHRFALEPLREKMLEHLVVDWNTKFKNVYLREWDKPQSYAKFLKEKLTILTKKIGQDSHWKNY